MRILAATRPDVCFDAPWVVKEKMRILAAKRPDVCFDAPRVVKGKLGALCRILCGCFATQLHGILNKCLIVSG